MKIHFTIRGLLCLTLLVALGIGWFVDHTRITREAAEELSEARGEINHPTDRLRCWQTVLSIRREPSDAPTPRADNMPSLKLSHKYSIPKMTGGITDNIGQDSQN